MREAVGMELMVMAMTAMGMELGMMMTAMGMEPVTVMMIMMKLTTPWAV